MKTDKSIIADLPDKTEIKALCGLSRRQTALYGQAVEDLAKRLEESDGIQRRGIVLAMLMRLKQICNHPSHWLNDNVWAEEDSGKWARLREIAEVVAARQEKMLVFTQFREMTGPLADVPRPDLRPSRPGAAWRHRGEEPQDAGAAVPGGRDRAVLRAVAEGGRVRADADRGVACRACRSLVESGGRKPGHRPGFPYWTKEERAGAQIYLPRHGRGKDRRLDQLEERVVR